MKAALVLTTINIPHLLYGYADNFEKYGHTDEVEIIVIGDRKTPEEAKEPIWELNRRGIRAELLDIPAQEQWLKSFPELKEIIPYNSDNRRNLGYLMAVEHGAEIVISIDDDNYAMDDDFLGGHSIVGEVVEMKTAHSSNNWFNICTALKTDPPRTLYPRGFPYSKRWADDATFTTSSGRIMMNAGLWLKDPDVDAATRLYEPLEVIGANRERFMLGPGVYSPINSQNTAFHRDALPCYYFITMDAVLNGSKIDRYGDIWSGFFAVKVIQSMKHCVSCGLPLANHVRNKHDLLNDLQIELGGMILTESLIPIIESAVLKANSYDKAYLELAKAIEEMVSANEKFTADVKNYFYKITSAMKVWVDVCNEIM